MTIVKLMRKCGWVIAGTWLALSSVARAQPASHSRPSPAPLARPAAPVSLLSVSAAPSAAGVVNLNEAGADELEHLPGIGPAKARAIVEHRRAHPFHRVEELTRVKGIGKKTFARLRPYLTIFGPTTLTEEPPRGK
jgi:competence protein ComEA